MIMCSDLALLERSRAGGDTCDLFSDLTRTPGVCIPFGIRVLLPCEAGYSAVGYTCKRLWRKGLHANTR